MTSHFATGDDSWKTVRLRRGYAVGRWCMDMSIKREDYTRFKEAANKELPETFCPIHDYEHQEATGFFYRVL